MGKGTRQEKLMLKGLSKTCKAVLPAPNTTVGAQVADGMSATSELMKAAAHAQEKRGAFELSKHVGKGARVLGKGAEWVTNQEEIFKGLDRMLDMDDMKLEISMRATGQRAQMLSRIKVKTAERDRWASEAARLRAELNRLGGCSDPEAKTVIAGGGRGPNSMNPMNLFDQARCSPPGYDERQMLAIGPAGTDGHSALTIHPSNHRYAAS